MVVMDPFDRFNMADQDRQEAKDASWECPHGRLPHDNDLSCGCWPVPAAPQLLTARQRLRNRYHDQERRAA